MKRERNRVASLQINTWSTGAVSRETLSDRALGRITSLCCIVAFTDLKGRGRVPRRPRVTVSWPAKCQVRANTQQGHAGEHDSALAGIKYWSYLNFSPIFSFQHNLPSPLPSIFPNYTPSTRPCLSDQDIRSFVSIPASSSFLRPDRTKIVEMLSNMLLCLVLVALTVAADTTAAGTSNPPPVTLTITTTIFTVSSSAVFRQTIRIKAQT